MNFFFRKSTLDLDVFTYKKYVMETSPIDHGINKIPQWWRDLPKSVQFSGECFPRPTMKTCIGMYDYYAKSVAMPLWSDLAIEIREDQYLWEFSDLSTKAGPHPNWQHKGFLDKSQGHLKLTSPWHFKTKEDLNWGLLNPSYSMENLFRYSTLPGVLNFNKQGNTNIQMVLNLDTPRNFIIPFGTPIALFMPFTDKKVKIHRHLVSREEFENLEFRKMPITFINKHKKHLEQNKYRCPYKDETK